jgi:phage terminase large subunit
MTKSGAVELLERRVGRPRTSDRERGRFGDSIALRIRMELAHHTGLVFPSPEYQQRPVEFFTNVLGVQPWSKQIEIINLVRDHKRVAVRSGHKVSKSNTAAGIALWFYCSFSDARVIMTSATSRQVDQILWRELRMMRARSGRCLECKAEDPDGLRIPRPCSHSALIEGEQGELARTGLKASDFREVVGFTAKDAEGIAGISGRNLLYIVDEASGVDDVIFEALEGNRAGGARIVMFGNPTRNEGEFYEAFYSKSNHYHTLTVSSEETPNVTEGRVVIPGLATREWIDEKRDEWGENSPLYLIRVKGQHALAEEGRIFSVHVIESAEARWAETPDAGRLFVGLDPAGESGSGDETVFSARRGLKQTALKAHRGLNEEQHLTQLLEYLAKWKLPRETPVVVVDREGSIGSRLFTTLRNYAETTHSFDVVGVRASDKAIRRPMVYDRMRDELAANLEQWFRDGGAIIEDVKLAAELHTFEWKQNVNGRFKLTPKTDVKKAIGRSPDRYDALALSAWEPLSLREAPAGAQQLITEREARAAGSSGPLIDPYAGANPWKK